MSSRDKRKLDYLFTASLLLHSPPLGKTPLRSSILFIFPCPCSSPLQATPLFHLLIWNLLGARLTAEAFSASLALAVSVSGLTPLLPFRDRFTLDATRAVTGAFVQQSTHLCVPLPHFKQV